MMEPGARGEILSIAFAGAGQHQDAGAKLVHVAPNTSGQIISKSISKNGGRASYRGLVKVEKGAKNVKTNVVCDALILDAKSRSDTYPYIEIAEQDVSVGHEASVSRIGEEQLFYLMNWPFLTFTARPVLAAAMRRSVCRAKKAGICSRSQTVATGAACQDS